MRLTTVLATLALFVAIPAAAAAAAAAEDATDPHELLARAKQAAGGAAWDRVERLRTTATLSTGGLSGTVEGLEDLTTGRYRNSFDLGVVRGAEGFDGQSSWSRDTSGDVLVADSQGDVEASRTQAYRVALGYWYPERWPAEIESRGEVTRDGRSYFVLSIVPEGGRAFEIWFDRETLFVARFVEQGAQNTTTSELSDYREVEGVLLPFHILSSSEIPGSEVEVTVTAVEVNPAQEENAFAVPQVKVEDFHIAGDASSVTVPFELLNHHIYIEAAVGDHPPRRFLVDTGGANLLTDVAAAEMGVESQGSIPVQGAGEGSVTAGIAKLDRFTIGAIRFDGPTFIVLPLDEVMRAGGVDFAGLVGFEVFKRFVVTIDYAAGRLTLTRPEAFRYQGSGTRIPFHFDGRHPVVEGAVDGVPGTFTIDTGSRASLDLHRPFIEANGLEARYRPRLEGITGWGVGGPVRSGVARTRSLKLGEVEIGGVLTLLTRQEQGAFTDRYLAGNVGGGVLRRFTVIFDYTRQEMILEPNAHFGDPDVFDRSGLWINQVDGAFEVMDLIAGGPAAEAGLEVGDRIVAVDGRKAVEALGLPELRLRFRTDKPGTRIGLALEGEGGQSREVELTLRELVPPLD